ncbi:MAG: RidA family protein [bacterium]
MKTTILLLTLSLFLNGCGLCKNMMHEAVQEEISKHSEVVYLNEGSAIAPYTPAITAGGFLFVSGQLGFKPGTQELPEDIESQTRQTLENLLALVKKSGYSTSDVIQCTVYLKDISDFAKMNSVYATFFEQGKRPTRATVEISNLVRNAKIEISAIAYKAK